MRVYELAKELGVEWKEIQTLLAEKFDFGTPQRVNALYGSLLTVTPFSKDEASTYDRILRDRHGGAVVSPTA